MRRAETTHIKKQAAIDLLKRQIKELDEIYSDAVRHKTSPQFDNQFALRFQLFDADLRKTIVQVFSGKDDIASRFLDGLPNFSSIYRKYIERFERGETRMGLSNFLIDTVSRVKDLLNLAIKRVDAIFEEDEMISTAPQKNVAIQTNLERRVFIVHGHDDAALQAVARFMERMEFEVVILHEKANQGRTVIEKFEANTDVAFAVVLLTPDDMGGKDVGNLRARARQNVILELGYFIGRLGRNRVVALKKGDLEFPSDILGVLAETIDDQGAWKQKLAKELREAGYEIDWDKAMR